MKIHIIVLLVMVHPYPRESPNILIKNFLSSLSSTINVTFHLNSYDRDQKGQAAKGSLDKILLTVGPSGQQTCHSCTFHCSCLILYK